MKIVGQGQEKFLDYTSQDQHRLNVLSLAGQVADEILPTAVVGNRAVSGEVVTD